VSDQAITAALKAAVAAYDHARVASHGGDYERDGMSDANQATIAPMIAGAIAAFLRALGNEVYTGRLHSAATGWIGIGTLANEVEEAAR
jgi:hypothetical protein